MEIVGLMMGEFPKCHRMQRWKEIKERKISAINLCCKIPDLKYFLS